MKWHWDFGDLSSSTEGSPIHTYSGSKASFDVVLTMEDKSGCKQSYKETVELKGCEKAEFDYEICPDGRVTFNAKNANPLNKLTWEFPGAKVPTIVALTHKTHPWIPLPIGPAEMLMTQRVQRPWVYYTSPGIYEVKLTLKSKMDGCVTFIKAKRVEIASVNCCNRPNESIRETKLFSDGPKQYKMKAVLSQTNLPFYHQLVARTKIRQKAGVFWKRYNSVVEIQATIAGKAYKDQGGWVESHVTHKACCCFSEKGVNGDSGSITGKWKAVSKVDLGGAFRTRIGSVSSSHRVKISGTSENQTIPPLSLGKSCAYR